MAKPKKWTSWRVCPNCGSRATKLFHLSAKAKPIECQACGHQYNPPLTKQMEADHDDTVHAISSA